MTDGVFPWVLGGLALLGTLAGVSLGWAAAKAYGRHLDRREVRRRNPIEWEGVE